MTVYLILIGYILLLPILADRLLPVEKRERFILDMGILALFLLFALKKDTVGTDIPGYREQYDISAGMAWWDTDYVYFEAGFIQLMKLFSKLGLDFQVFTIYIYGICCGAYREFIRRCSPNATLSLLIFICYQFLVFHMSGLRQALAMALCVWAYLIAEGKRWSSGARYFWAAALIVLASTVHRSAILALGVLAVLIWKPQRVHWAWLAVLLAGAAFFRAPVHRLIRWITGEAVAGGQITLGGNFVFLLGMTVLALVGYYNAEKEDAAYPAVVTVLMLAAAAQILFSGSALLRSAMYLTVFLIPGLPMVLKRFEGKLEVLGTWLLGVFLVWLFWHDTLRINQLKLCPYLFFWQ